MYSSSYSRAKLGLDARELHRPRGKSCGYYVKIVFFFSSLIQSLIIVSLVLFLVYGQPEKSAEEKRVKELEQNINHLGEINLQLRKDKVDLNAQITAKAAEKAAVEKELETVKAAANTTEYEFKKKVSDLEKQLAMARSMGRTTPIQPPIVFNPASSEVKTLQTLNAQQKAMIDLIQANFTQMVNYLSQERDTADKERNLHHQEAITQRKENAMLKEQLTVYSRKCKEDFAQSLDGIKIVTSEFLKKINTLFPHQMSFHLSCSSQAEQMEKIRNSCTNLSSDVEKKFQIYLDVMGDNVAEIQALSSRMEVVNTNLKSDLKVCETTRAENAAEAARQLELKQKNHDNQVERLLNEQNRLRNQKKLEEDRLAIVQDQLKLAKAEVATCKPGPRMGGGAMIPGLQNKPITPNLLSPVRPPSGR
ncbi:plasmalemma vesicle associated protein b isoform X2 [Periophthalmus magnuspinnatus]|uniref:plasmalemma vesicle associated protein b isoform X2 n=1 Tax=Periophthalmus magnuspinnatus TaxID=409849 RepID=UPI00145B686D|nr:plasmalemma vesicle associated protein b isoform X2 [Periophthalmus magnuspinnatus]